MKVLITGGAGFIGSSLADIFIETADEVIIVDDLSTGKIDNVNRLAKFIKIDICSNEFENVFKEHEFDAVFHFAAQTGVGKSAIFPKTDAEKNILGSINLFSLCEKYGIKRVIAVSSAAVYGSPEYLPVDELHPLRPLSFYGLSKLTMENYLKMFDLDYTILRPSNVFGKRQTNASDAGVITIFAEKIKNCQPVEIHGDGLQTRDFIYIDDFVKVCRLCLEKDVRKRILNVSTSSKTSINELYSILCETIAPKSAKIAPIYLPPRCGDIKDSILNNALMKELLDFQPSDDLRNNLIKL